VCAFLPTAGLGVLTKLLKVAGYSVITATSFPSALRWLHTEAPDAILLDEKFAILDGLSSADIIREILPNAVVILVNANDPNLSAVVQSLSDRLGKRQMNGAGGSGS
jgi:DNA-binding response OmpR family regulator